MGSRYPRSMSFTSVIFLLFVALSVILYYVLPKKFRWVILLLASYGFYLSNGLSSIIYIVVTTLSTFWVALMMDKISNKSAEFVKENKGTLSKEEIKAAKQKFTYRKRRWIVLLLIVNFGILAVVKYVPTIINSTGLRELLYPDDADKLFKILVPLGISFYTFTSMGYAIDVYRNKYHAETNLGKFALYVSFFPQIVQGPIARYDHLGDQLYEGHELKFDNLSYGAELILWGFFKKLIIADRVTVFVSEIYGNYEKYDGVMILLGVLCYCLQIYTDFSGGIDISRGIARLYGIELASNFERPYFSHSITEFWRRWHISLGNWMRDYVFYTIMFSRPYKKFSKFAKGKFGDVYGKILPNFITTYAVFMLIGIWHGASWNFVMFGFYNATVISLGQLLQPTFDKMSGKLKVNKESANWQFFEIFRTFNVNLVSKFFARAATLTASFKMMGSMFNLSKTWDYIFTHAAVLGDTMNSRSWLVVIFGTILLLVVSILQERGLDIHAELNKLPIAVRWFILFGLVIFVIWFGRYNSSQGIVDLIYGQF